MAYYPRKNDLGGFSRVKLRRIKAVTPIHDYRNYYYCGYEGIWVKKDEVRDYTEESTALERRPLCPSCGRMVRTHRQKRVVERSRPLSRGYVRTVDRLGFLINADEKELDRFKMMSDSELMNYMVSVFQGILLDSDEREKHK